MDFDATYTSEPVSKRNWLVVTAITCLVAAEFVLSIVYFAKSWSVSNFDAIDTLETLSRSVNAVGAAGDIGISGIIMVQLHRYKTGLKRSTIVLNRLILYSMTTGLITSICAIASLISISAWPRTLIFVAFYTILGRVYNTSALATLNAREKFREKLAMPSPTTFPQSIVFALGVSAANHRDPDESRSYENSNHTSGSHAGALSGQEL
ncbi:uncharacterized protein STEHIDRAFT_161700 [Stereum hirsutum FP-91666 SS1]|uniref:uncharacterized protein n=1 Tax=Stereum hirsutum (strain FP-91666) TaxID=721885 RepID=UPI000444A125|nr:uncharacterized protein STEHIDRAFT_161700 [Stereum hirsutum FP-91666 SS1]EIM81516.1 hypothetical protein STEHIDRAFT_161700 [Stereum hirsutum FP-91666 SS1]